MSLLGKRIIVLMMVWVMLFMIVSQIYDNVTGKGMPDKQQTSTLTTLPTPGQDPDTKRLADLQACVASNPSDLKCTQDLADFYYAAGQYPQAQANYERAIKLDPHNVAMLQKLAGSYIYQQKFDRSVATLQQAAALSPDSPQIHLLLGLSLSKLNPPRMQDALREWRMVLKLAPGTTLASQATDYINSAGQ